MIANESAYRGYRVIRRASGAYQFTLYQRTRTDHCPLPPPRRVVTAADTLDAARRLIDAVWSGDPAPLRPVLAAVPDNPDLARWLAEAETRAARPLPPVRHALCTHIMQEGTLPALLLRFEDLSWPDGSEALELTIEAQESPGKPCRVARIDLATLAPTVTEDHPDRWSAAGRDAAAVRLLWESLLIGWDVRAQERLAAVS